MSDQQAPATKSPDTTEDPSKEAACSVCGAETHTAGWHNNPDGWHNRPEGS